MIFCTRSSTLISLTQASEVEETGEEITQVLTVIDISPIPPMEDLLAKNYIFLSKKMVFSILKIAMERTHDEMGKDKIFHS